MPRCALLLLFASAALLAQSAPPQKEGELKGRRPAATSGKEEVPPEEDVSISRDEFTFNPLQAEKEVRAGDFYFKKRSFLAAAKRFQNATKFNEGNSEAWLKLGEAQEKLKDRKAAREAYSKYLEVASDAKNAGDIRKKLDKLK